MKVESYFKDILKERKIHLTLLDPEEQTPAKALAISKAAVSGGSDGIMLGGSTTDAAELDATAKILQENLDVPIVLFPGNISGVSSYADAIFFMSLLNSSNPYWIIGAQALGAPVIKKMGIETIPMGYLVIEPGGTVGWVGDAKLIPRKKADLATAYAMAAEYLGMRLIYLEAGSGAEQHVDPKMIGMVKKTTDTMLIVGGGIRSGDEAHVVASAGADIIVTGTVVEDSVNVEEKISEIVEGMRR
ncbi:MAG: geranylgeranylglyceryl/heptaprenylglyceryl phosphate synthase [Methanobacteriaceae archaeon]|nr:geranylgeranylglyceryl/heptaprenylglyceryl phosphate synthase [Methanobacteriaceae archaeon]MDP2835700.1 geranylgeranylglyceryl/heptaprenylglyceryl phosphate synthase [Methanobacteriaceae archaeon]MDP3035028.1 geranylgeranylglyceryl/heptaprenylglyceryl phosphate synthase [Methanobacteriaceae archaeon]MDP3484041.1 geranylgeranylglyceryl/heptaprenylglyceryl phosphate synthase [Methanobacteriaceae archaeon]MDP3624552.1 geranylgeranylglyceryl/heptaprenylglyceryl phosphate synthase [Methanobacter